MLNYNVGWIPSVTTPAHTCKTSVFQPIFCQHTHLTFMSMSMRQLKHTIPSHTLYAYMYFCSWVILQHTSLPGWQQGRGSLVRPSPLTTVGCAAEWLTQSWNMLNKDVHIQVIQCKI